MVNCFMPWKKRQGLLCGVLWAGLLLAGATRAHARSLPPIVMTGAVRAHISQQALQQWVQDLQSQDAKVRRRALVGLVQSGEPAKDALVKALNGLTTPLMRQHLHAALLQVARHSAVGSPRVTLRMSDAPVKNVLQRLCQQVDPYSQLQLTLSQHFSMPRLTINVRHASFWKVICRIAKESDISPAAGDAYDATGVWNFSSMSGITQKTPVSVRGPFLLDISDLYARQSIDFTRGLAQRPPMLQIEFNGFWCPAKSRILGTGPAVIRTLSVDDVKSWNSRGGRMPPLLANVQSNGIRNSYAGISMFADVPWSWTTGRRISAIAGKLPVRLAIAPRTDIFKLAGKVTTLKFDGLKVRIMPQQPKPAAKPGGAGSDHVVTVDVLERGSATMVPMSAQFLRCLPTAAFGYVASLGGEIGFLKADGTSVPCRLGRSVGGSGWRYRVHFQSGLPKKVWITTYHGFVQASERFRFNNVPLPAAADATKAVEGKPFLLPDLRIQRRRLLGGQSAPIEPRVIDLAVLNRHIAQLAEYSRTTQASARRSLLALGPEAIAAIREAINGLRSPQERGRLVDILACLEEQRALRGPLVDVSTGSANIAAGLKHIFDQIHGKFTVGASAIHGWRPKKAIKAKMEFWQAVRLICSGSGIGPTIGWDEFNPSRVVTFGPRSILGAYVPRELTGSCLLTVPTIQRSEDEELALGFRDDPNGVLLKFLILWASIRGEVIEQMGHLQAHVSVLGRTQALIKKISITSPSVFWPKVGQMVFPFRLPLGQLPTNAASLNIDGQLSVYIAGLRMTREAEGLDRFGAAINFPGMQFHFGAPLKTSKRYRVIMRVILPNMFYGGGSRRHWIAFGGLQLLHYFRRRWGHSHELVFLSRTGRTLSTVSKLRFRYTSPGNWADRIAAVEVTGGKPVAVKIKWFTRTIRLKIPFSFAAIPVPQ
ncbi:MAG: hypothetical protein HKL96_00770 [Phycisphaerales bacterium]|nr:hypothetical protein [Phycisphaerales bacterium]